MDEPRPEAPSQGLPRHPGLLVRKDDQPLHEKGIEDVTHPTSVTYLWLRVCHGILPGNQPQFSTVFSVGNISSLLMKLAIIVAVAMLDFRTFLFC